MGGHYHCHLFSAKAKNMTFACLGNVVLAEEEWDMFRNLLHHAIEFVAV
jgi:hypothetical protein